MIKEVEVKTFIQHLYCDKCHEKDGSLNEMELLPEVLMSYPPQYQYRCPICGNTKIMAEGYPKTIFRTIDELNKIESER